MPTETYFVRRIRSYLHFRELICQKSLLTSSFRRRMVGSTLPQVTRVQFSGRDIWNIISIEFGQTNQFVELLPYKHVPRKRPGPPVVCFPLWTVGAHGDMASGNQQCTMDPTLNLSIYPHTCYCSHTLLKNSLKTVVSHIPIAKELENRVYIPLT